MKLIRLTIKSKEQTLFSDDVLAITAYNDLGIFDVLPMHANFISLIKNKVIAHRQKGDQEFKIGDNTVLKADSGSVDIYLGL